MDKLSHALCRIAITLPLVGALHASAAHADGTLPWVGTWGVAPQTVSNQGFNNQTIRQIMHTSIAGSAARVHLSNLFGTQPLVIGEVHLAQRGSGSSIVPGTDHALTFNGAASVTIPAGGQAISDPVTMTVPALSDMAVSVYLPSATGPNSTGHRFALQDVYVAAGDVTSSTSLTGAKTNPGLGQVNYFLTNLDVQNASATGAVATFGASITDGFGSAPNTNRRWPNDLAKRFSDAGMRVGVIDAGITGNQLLADGSGQAGVTRFARDVVQQPGVKWVVISDDPINDLTSHNPPPTSDQLTAGLRQIIGQAHRNHLKVLCSTLTPYQGYSAWTAAQESIREQVNSFIRGSASGCDAVVDQDAAIHDSAQPTQIRADFDSGDHLHPNAAGMQAIANVVDLRQFAALPPVQPISQCGQVAPGVGLKKNSGFMFFERKPGCRGKETTPGRQLP